MKRGLIQRHVRWSGGLHLQYREAGRGGMPLVLLHASPRCSAMYEPWMQQLADQFHVLAVDTPGYGGSDPLPTPPASLADYVAPLHQLLSEVIGQPFLLYGSATGSQLAIAYALEHPAALLHLLLDNAAHFEPAEHEHIVANYFPDLSPRDDGSHLLEAWRISAGMLQYFPWFEQDDAHRFRADPPSADEIHATFAALLAAGSDYALAYRAAFDHERAENVQALRVPTTIFRWQGSILLKQIDALLAKELPPQVRSLDIPAPMVQRMAAMQQHLLSLRDTCLNLKPTAH